MIHRAGGCLLAVAIVLGGLLVLPAPRTQAQGDDEGGSGRAVNVELILDVSGSMAQVVDTGETRMEAAKRVLREVVGAIPEQDGINVGLRIYGHEGNNTDAGQAESCQSSDLVAPIEGVNKRTILGEIEGLQPTGWTPLALSLERAGEDFEASEGATNAAVLVTDGLETCGGDPCAVAGDLHDADIELITHVVGFGLVPEEQATLGCIAEEGGGLLLSAASAAELTAALFEVLEQLEVVQGVGFIGGNALPVLPEGEAGELSVIGVGAYDGNVLPIVVRNNTGEDVIRITAVASAKNPAGQLIGSGNDQGFNPNLVRSGGVAIGYAYFGGVALPPDTEFEVDLDAKPATDDQFENFRDLEVVEASTVEGRVVGTLQNAYDAELTGPINVVAACFDEAGTLLSHRRDFSTKERLAPDETVAIQVADFLGGPCPLFLVAGSGYDNTFSQDNDVEPPTDDEGSEAGPATTAPSPEDSEADQTEEPADDAAADGFSIPGLEDAAMRQFEATPGVGEGLISLSTVAARFASKDAADRGLDAMVDRYFALHGQSDEEITITEPERVSAPQLGDRRVAYSWSMTHVPTGIGFTAGMIVARQADVVYLLLGQAAGANPVTDLADVGATIVTDEPRRPADDGSKTGGLWDLLPTLDEVPFGLSLSLEKIPEDWGPVPAPDVAAVVRSGSSRQP